MLPNYNELAYKIDKHSKTVFNNTVFELIIYNYCA